MLYIPTSYDIPYYNMALEQYLLYDKRFSENEYLFFYIHRPSVIIGYNQNAYAEVNAKYVKQNNITVARRLSGGGAVYHDEGNLNFSFILKRASGELVNFEKHTLPVINALKKLNLNASLSGRNDILINGKKISGNAEFTCPGRLLHHGTLMFDVNIENMVSALNVSDIKIKAKAVSSVRSRVTNIKENLGEDYDIYRLIEELKNSFVGKNSGGIYNLSEEDKQNVQRLVDEKFSLDSYNYGTKQSFSFEKQRRFACGIVCVGLNVKKGVIAEAGISGDFFTNGDITVLQKALSGVFFDKTHVESAVADINFGQLIVNFTKAEFLSLLFE